jgi:hypothetical protein
MTSLHNRSRPGSGVLPSPFWNHQAGLWQACDPPGAGCGACPRLPLPIVALVLTSVVLGHTAQPQPWALSHLMPPEASLGLRSPSIITVIRMDC